MLTASPNDVRRLCDAYEEGVKAGLQHTSGQPSPLYSPATAQRYAWEYGFTNGVAMQSHHDEEQNNG